MANNPYKDSVKVAIIFQCLAAILAFGIMSDEPGLVWIYTFIAFWTGYFLIKAKRKQRPTHFDLFLIKWSFVPLYLIAVFIAGYIWRLRGVI